ncbi:uncharacterized protein LOC127001353 [Eriocheir sinensis]|uniref:uncharacterized protein LOC127001353 n=1 Tax=Eriocheir sinensis TaxID=95602 RepID=UPI0021C922A2|nr:uncharacterized protein LOC127001353 [Eriocheir sinensis]
MVLVITTRTPTAARTPTPMVTSAAHETREHLNYTLPILVVRENLSYRPSQDDARTRLTAEAGRERKKDEEEEEDRLFSGPREDEAISSLFPSPSNLPRLPTGPKGERKKGEKEEEEKEKEGNRFFSGPNQEERRSNLFSSSSDLPRPSIEAKRERKEKEEAEKGGDRFFSGSNQEERLSNLFSSSSDLPRLSIEAKRRRNKNEEEGSDRLFSKTIEEARLSELFPTSRANKNTNERLPKSDRDEKEEGKEELSRLFSKLEEEAISELFPSPTPNQNTREVSSKSVSDVSLTGSHTAASLGHYEKEMLAKLFPSTRRKNNTDTDSKTSDSDVNLARNHETVASLGHYEEDMLFKLFPSSALNKNTNRRSNTSNTNDSITRNHTAIASLGGYEEDRALSKLIPFSTMNQYTNKESNTPESDTNPTRNHQTASFANYEEGDQVLSRLFPFSTLHKNANKESNTPESDANPTASLANYEEDRVLSELFPFSTQHKNTNKESNIPENDTTLLHITLKDPNATFPNDNLPDGQRTKPNPEVLNYFARLIADINAAAENESNGASGRYKLLPVATGRTILTSEGSDSRDMDQSSSRSDGHYLLESEPTPSTFLYSFPLVPYPPSGNNGTGFDLKGKPPEGLSDTPDKEFHTTYESLEAGLNAGKTSGSQIWDELTGSSPIAENRRLKHHEEDHALQPDFQPSVKESGTPEGSEEVLESSASGFGAGYLAHLPRPVLVGDGVYQYGSGHPLEAVPHYAFEYVVRDPLHGGLHGHTETRHGKNTHGRYFILLPDGRLQTVTYIANEHGYFPQMVYTGEAKPFVRPPGVSKPFYRALNPLYHKDKFVMPHAVLFKPKSAYVIKYGDQTPYSSLGVPFKPNYVTPAPLLPVLKPGYAPGLTTAIPPLLTSPATYVSPFSSPYHNHHKPYLTTTLGPVISPRPLIVTKSQPRPYPYSLTASKVSLLPHYPTPQLTPRPVFTSHPPLVTSRKPSLTPFLPTVKGGLSFSPLDSHSHVVPSSPAPSKFHSDFSPSHPSVIHSLHSTSSPHGHHVSHSPPKFSHHHHHHHPSPIHFSSTTPYPKPFHPTVITTTLKPRPKPHPHVFHASHEPYLDRPPFSVSVASSAEHHHHGYSKKESKRPSVISTTTIITSEPNPEPHNVFTIGVTERPRRLAASTTTTTVEGKRSFPTLKPKPIYPETESESESLYTSHPHSERDKGQVLVTTPPEFADARLKGYSSPKSTDVLEDSFLGPLLARGVKESPRMFVTPPSAKETFESHSLNHDETTSTPDHESPSNIPSDTPQTTKTHDSPPEKPFSPSKPAPHTPKRPHVLAQSPSTSSSPSEHSEPHKYSIDIRVAPGAYPSHGTLFRAPSPASHRHARQHSNHEDADEPYNHSVQPDKALSSAPVSFDPFLRHGSFIIDSSTGVEPLSHVPETLSAEPTESHLLEPLDAPELLPWRPLSIHSPLSPSSVYHSPPSPFLYPYSSSSSSSVKRESAGRYHSLEGIEDSNISGDQTRKESPTHSEPENLKEEEEEGFTHGNVEHEEAEKEYVVRVEASVHSLPNRVLHLSSPPPPPPPPRPPPRSS